MTPEANLELIKARKRLKLTQKVAAKMIGIAQQRLSEYEVGRIVPSEKIRKRIKLIYDKLDCSPKEVEKEAEAILSHLYGVPYSYIDDPRKGFEKEAQIELFLESLSSLTEREQYVLRNRFGFDGRGENTVRRTLKEIGKDLGIGKERVRQIETKAIRRLRHPKFSKK